MAIGLNDIGHCIASRRSSDHNPRLAPTSAIHLEDIWPPRAPSSCAGRSAIRLCPESYSGNQLQGWITIELYPYVDDPDQAASTALGRVRAILAEIR